MQSQLVDAKEVKVWTNQTNLQEAQRLKQQGNSFFIKKQYKNALKKYHQALLHANGIIDNNSSMVMYAKPASKQISNSVNLLKFGIWLNMSQIYIYQQKYQRCLDILKKAEQLIQKSQFKQPFQKSIPKLCYRKGVSYMKANYFDEAKKQFEKLKQIDQSFNNDIQQFQKQIKGRQKIADQKSKKLFKGFFK